MKQIAQRDGRSVKLYKVTSIGNKNDVLGLAVFPFVSDVVAMREGSKVPTLFAMLGLSQSHIQKTSQMNWKKGLDIYKILCTMIFGETPG